MKLNMRSQVGIFFALLCAASVSAQLAVTVRPPKVVGQKAIVSLAMTNNLADKVESARAVCFLLDGQGRMVGQSSKWVIGGNKSRSALEPKKAATFNFVITSPQPWTATNLTARISFSRIVLSGGKLADVQRDVIVSAATK